MDMLAHAVESYQVDNAARLPATLERLLEEDELGTSYLNGDAVPRDPWGNEFVLEKTSDHDFLLWSYGADGVRGGEGANADFNHATVRDRAR